MKYLVTVSLLFFLTGNATGQEASGDSVQLPQLKEILLPILRGALITNDDLRLRDDYLKRDSMRIALVDSFMTDPFYLEAFGKEVYYELAKDPPLWKLLNYCSQLLRPLSKEFAPVAPNKSILKPHDLPGETNRPIRPPAAQPKFTKMPDKLRISLNTLYNAAFNAREFYDEAFREVNRDSLIYGFTMLLTDDEMNEKKSVEELDSLEKMGEEWSKALADILPRFKMGALLAGGKIMARPIDDLLVAGKDDLFSGFKLEKPSEIETELGKVAIGTEANDNYSGRYFAIIDPGGDDKYQLYPTYGGQITVIIDYSGNDVYRFVNDSLYTFTPTAKTLIRRPLGIGGYKFLIDYGGDDIFNGDDFTLAAGILGISVFKDYDGDDTYITDTFGPASGAIGVGLLMDFKGRDTYNGAMYNEGFGFTGGLGILFDKAGHDNYLSGGKYGDILRYTDHYITFSQGAAYGLRPYFSGGIGMLLDGSGNDLYVSDIFGQASGYWYSAGIIYDASGNDRYQSFQYAQGAGAHMAVGCLRDDSGDDVYFSKGVSQGCGHDYCQGWLVDYSGNDLYSAYDLSQGAGSANGIGAIIDIKGDDRYYVKSDQNTQGYGRPNREYGSIGLFYDGAGLDHYEGGLGKDSDIWIYSTWGIGWDQPTDSTKTK